MKRVSESDRPAEQPERSATAPCRYASSVMVWLAELSSQVGHWIANEIIVKVVSELSAKLTAAIGRVCRRGLQPLCVLALWTRATLRRLVVVAAMATMAGLPADGAGQRPQETTAPFEGLRVIDGVATSNDDYGI